MGRGFAAWLVGLVGCTGSTLDPTGKDTDTDTDVSDTDTDTDTVDTQDTVTTETGTVPEGSGVRGILVGPDGAPLPETDVLCCTVPTCWTAPTDAEGRFVFALDPGMSVALKTHEVASASPRLASALEPAVTSVGPTDVGEVYVPDLPAGAPLGGVGADPQTLGVGDGLELTLNQADLVPPFGVFLVDIAARAVPSDRWPEYPDAGGDVIAVYALYPFETLSVGPIGVRLPTDLPAGTPVTFHSVNELDGSLSEGVPGTSDGTWLATDPAGGIDRLTHLVVTRASR